MKLPENYYHNPDVVALSHDLIGKYLFTSIDGDVTGGYIVETEAYAGVIDKASHSFGGRMTPRTQTMYMQGGVSYVYLCYGIHEMFNIVTSAEGTPHAILIRGIQPTDGLDVMMMRRNMETLKPNITKGPGSVARALGISRKINALSLQSDTIWVEDKGLIIPDDEVASGPRIGVGYAGDDALLPYRFYVKGNIYVSKPNK
ncbi:DNA-3-methyladenine glycosylase [Mucilaginibacter sp.]|uniref:DNA-3-methyladenine glycosylase n=1 Tax=Mucilaginibacter sp. TaxID=1882438 RepID=UPI0035BC17CE